MEKIQERKEEFSQQEQEEIGKAVGKILKLEPEVIEEKLVHLSEAKNKIAISCIRVLDTNIPTEKLVREMGQMRHEVAIIEKVISQTKAARQLLGKDEFYNAMSEHGLIGSQE